MSSPERSSLCQVLWLGGGDVPTEALAEHGVGVVQTRADLDAAQVHAWAPDAIVLCGDAASRASTLAEELRVLGAGACAPIIVNGAGAPDPRVLAAQIPASAPASALATKVAQVAAAGATRAGWPAQPKADDLEALIEVATLDGRAGLVAAEGVGVMAIADGRTAGASLDALTKADALRASERSAARVSILSDATSRGRDVQVDDATVVLVGGEGDALSKTAAALHVHGAFVHRVPCEAAALAQCSTLEPALIVVLASDLASASGTTLATDAKLGLAGLLVVDGEAAQSADAVCERVSALYAAELAARESLEQGQGCISRVEFLGAPRWLKLVAKATGTAVLEIHGAPGLGRVEVTGGKIREASFKPAESDETSTGRDALSNMLRVRSGTVFLGRPDVVAQGRPSLPSAQAGAPGPIPSVPPAARAKSLPPGPSALPGAPASMSNALRAPGVPRAMRAPGAPGVPRPAGMRMPMPRPGGLPGPAKIPGPRVPSPPGATGSPALVPPPAFPPAPAVPTPSLASEPAITRPEHRSAERGQGEAAGIAPSAHNHPDLAVFGDDDADEEATAIVSFDALREVLEASTKPDGARSGLPAEALDSVPPPPQASVASLPPEVLDSIAPIAMSLPPEVLDSEPPIAVSLPPEVLDSEPPHAAEPAAEPPRAAEPAAEPPRAAEPALAPSPLSKHTEPEPSTTPPSEQTRSPSRGAPAWAWALGATLAALATGWAVWHFGPALGLEGALPAIGPAADASDETHRATVEPAAPPVPDAGAPTADEPAGAGTPTTGTPTTGTPTTGTPVPVVAPDGASIDDLFEQMRQAQLDQRYADVESLARRALSIQANNGRAAYLLALALLRQQRRDEAVPWAERAIALDPTSGSSLVLLGDIQIQSGRRSAALRAWRRCIELVPDYEPCQRRLGPSEDEPAPPSE